MCTIKTENAFAPPTLPPLERAGKRLAEAVSATFVSLDRWVVRLVLRLNWKNNRRAAEERIRAFEATEDDSAWQLLHACSRLREPRVKAQLFLQAMEEAHHAEVFRALYEESSRCKLSKVSVARKPIFEEGQAWKLFAYCAVGEAAAARRFAHIAEALPVGEFRASLEKILREEEGHIELASGLVALTGKSPAEISREITRIKMVRAWEAWLRIGRGLTQLASRFLLSAAYFAMGFWLKPKGEK